MLLESKKGSFMKLECLVKYVEKNIDLVERSDMKLYLRSIKMAKNMIEGKEKRFLEGAVGNIVSMAEEIFIKLNRNTFIDEVGQS